MLRAQSIEGQIDGTIPSTDEGQELDKSAFIDGSSVDLTAMGSFDLGGPPGSHSASSTPDNAPEDLPDAPPPDGSVPEDLPDAPPPDSVVPDDLPDDSVPEAGDEAPDDLPPPPSGEIPEGLPDAPPDGALPEGLPPEGPPPGGAPAVEMETSPAVHAANIVILAVCLVVALASALIINKGVRRR